MDMTAISSSPRIEVPKSLAALAVLLLSLSALAAGYQASSTPVTLVVDGRAQQVRTHQDTIGAMLTDTALTLHPEDRVSPPPNTTLQQGITVTVQRAHPVRIVADGREVSLRTHATSVEAVLREVDLSIGPHDEVTVEGQFPPGNPSSDSGVDSEIPRLIVRRAVPFTLHEGGQATTLHTTAPTVGEALREAGLVLYLADRVQPNLGRPMSAGMEIHVDRSTPVTVRVDGRTLRTRTHRERVGEVLADLDVVLTGQDYTTPTLDSPLGRESTIRVVRVHERFLIEQEPIAFQSVWRRDPDLEIDHQRLLQEGAPGIRERRIRVRYEDGHEVARTAEDTYVAVPPTTNVMGYGTKIVVRSLDTPSGSMEYWRKVRMLATSYSASTAGTPKSKSWYGRTATGLKMRKGIVAVDPRVIDLGSKVYVPGYGVGLAGDTGGAIKGRRIDLGYDDRNLVHWYRWVDVYLLTPVPPADQIDYTLP